MSKPWEIELTEAQLSRFKRILEDLRYNDASFICPFIPNSCNKSRPTCSSFVKGLKRITRRRACPCHKFRTASLIWRIEALLEYNEQKEMK